MTTQRTSPFARLFTWAGILCIAAFFFMGLMVMRSDGFTASPPFDLSPRAWSGLRALTFFLGLCAFVAAEIAKRAKRAPPTEPFPHAKKTLGACALFSLALVLLAGLGAGVKKLWGMKWTRAEPIAAVTVPPGTRDLRDGYQGPGLYVARIVQVLHHDTRYVTVRTAGERYLDDCELAVPWALLDMQPPRHGDSVTFDRSACPWLETFSAPQRGPAGWDEGGGQRVLLEVGGDSVVKRLAPVR